VYPHNKQNGTDLPLLKESDVSPAEPEPGYGWEKLFMEKMCEYFGEKYKHVMQMRVGRFHNIYGPLGIYDGGKEKAPAALCRKVSLASNPGIIEIWGDGKQTRTFTYIDDCLEGVLRMMEFDHTGCLILNIGSSEVVTINQLAGMVIDASGKDILMTYVEDAPQGVRGRGSDNSLIRRTLNWEPSTRLADGMADTYEWINKVIWNMKGVDHA